jgi:hypothetical protein
MTMAQLAPHAYTLGNNALHQLRISAEQLGQ